MKKLFALSVVSLLVFAGCGQSEESSVVEDTDELYASPDEEVVEEVVEEEVIEYAEPELEEPTELPDVEEQPTEGPPATE